MTAADVRDPWRERLGRPRGVELRARRTSRACGPWPHRFHEVRGVERCRIGLSPGVVARVDHDRHEPGVQRPSVDHQVQAIEIPQLKCGNDRIRPEAECRARLRKPMGSHDAISGGFEHPGQVDQPSAVGVNCKN